jgi:hypothetical protein
MNHNRYELIIIGPIKFSLEKQTTFNMGFFEKTLNLTKKRKEGWV